MFADGIPTPWTPWLVFSLVLALWATFHIVQSRSGPMGKALWTAAVLLIPFFGFAAWLFFGPRDRKKS
jgi:hypothetical protein